MSTAGRLWVFQCREEAAPPEGLSRLAIAATHRKPLANGWRHVARGAVHVVSISEPRNRIHTGEVLVEPFLSPSKIPSAANMTACIAEWCLSCGHVDHRRASPGCRGRAPRGGRAWPSSRLRGRLGAPADPRALEDAANELSSLSSGAVGSKRRSRRGSRPATLPIEPVSAHRVDEAADELAVTWPCRRSGSPLGVGPQLERLLDLPPDLLHAQLHSADPWARGRSKSAEPAPVRCTECPRPALWPWRHLGGPAPKLESSRRRGRGPCRPLPTPRMAVSTATVAATPAAVHARLLGLARGGSARAAATDTTCCRDCGTAAGRVGRGIARFCRPSGKRAPCPPSRRAATRTPSMSGNSFWNAGSAHAAAAGGASRGVLPFSSAPPDLAQRLGELRWRPRAADQRIAQATGRPQPTIATPTSIDRPRINGGRRTSSAERPVVGYSIGQWTCVGFSRPFLALMPRELRDDIVKVAHPARWQIEESAQSDLLISELFSGSAFCDLVMDARRCHAPPPHE